MGLIKDWLNAAMHGHQMKKKIEKDKEEDE